MRNHCLSKHRPTTGSTTVVALLMLVVLSLIGANVLMSVTTRYGGTQKTIGWQEALSAAEAGADVALANLRWTINANGIEFDRSNGWSSVGTQVSYKDEQKNTFTLPARYTLAIPNQSGEGTVETWAVVDVDAPTAANTASPKGLVDAKGHQWFRIRSTGYAKLPGMARVNIDTLTDPNARHNNALRKFSLRVDRLTGLALTNASGAADPAPQATRRLEVIAQPVTPFQSAIQAVTSFNDFGSNTNQVDSFDSSDPTKSTNGLYDATKSQKHGNVYVDSKAVGNFTAGGGKIYGDIGTNGGNVQPSASIVGKIDNDVQLKIPTVPSPLWGLPGNPAITANLGDISGNKSVTAGTAAAPTYYKLNTIKKQLTITLPAGNSTGIVYLWQQGDFAGDDLTGQIVIPKGVTAILYFEGDIKMKPGDFDNQNYNAAFLQLYGIKPSGNNTQTVTFNGSGNFYGVLYAPNAAIQFLGNSHAMGSLVGNTLAGNGATSVHYDEDLYGLGSPVDYRGVSWVEDDR
jgi:Tfp pilus assembly protein PilX